MRLAVCIPVFNDWHSAMVLLERLDHVAASIDGTLDVFYVDDGSYDPLPEQTEQAFSNLGEISIIRLRRNLGHQRAIAIGLTYLYDRQDHDAVYVMDGDGEDNPAHLVDLLERYIELGGETAVFAKRTRRVEGLGFRAGFIAFKLLHRVMTGLRVEIGNFSILPRSALMRLVGISEMWNHYAAALTKAHIPISKLPLARERRISGQSKMNFISLVVHGLSAISVFGDTVGVRLLCMTGSAMLLSALGLVSVIAIRYRTDAAVPGWATSTAGLLLVSLLNLTGICMVLALSILKSRSEAAFLPIRDYKYFILEEQSLRDLG